jgi:hypothetical protein
LHFALLRQNSSLDACLFPRKRRPFFESTTPEFF